ncbi:MULTISPECIES: WbqC family protein [Burkholderia]|uniref:WbqC family protein n=1 Tax=Burkholderia TaxID=32008 RepID=UPI000666BE5D|nr:MULTISPECIES: WbqC family protein [Burkholderia]MBJ9591198.1 WbqC family protein [Burkholderia seminalis]MBN3741378.1 WbqC family protein [Burkholderia sp. Tr-20355]MCA8305430.1 WbqC family protein [Burkholderia seminalis]MCA8427255.1 WbqC family protein [Burkholderia seminalis]MCA8434013.1 WbqC family protein [Burkholderia seminalis]
MNPQPKRIAIVQSNYIPWKGYFDLIAATDEFILYDDAQYTRRDWRNRNQIKTPQGVQWLTVPVKVKGRYHQSIRETEIDGTQWAQQHWTRLRQNYARAPHFARYAEQLEALYLNGRHDTLSALNLAMLAWINRQLGIATRISSSSDYTLEGDRTDKLLNLCLQAGATEYLSGPAARDYLDESRFAAEGIAVRWFDYPAYPPYAQLWGEFVHGVTVLDVLFHCGPEARRHVVTGRT